MTITQAASLELRGVDVTINRHQVLRGIGLSILPGEFFVILGAAEAGKSALLRAVAGLDPVSAGEIWIDDQEITRQAANHRGTAMMLQSFPLWDHMTVTKNVRFALRGQGLPTAEVRKRVEDELALVGLGDFQHHLPRQLSPAQRQRVALIRTLINGARINLLDEPFSAQDSQLRERLLFALKKRQQLSAVTTVLTTQNREEALRVADRIALLHEGELQQVGTPTEMYDMPRNRHVAEYMGSANLIDGEVEFAGDQPLFRTHNGFVIPLFDHPVKRTRTGSAMFRPHDLRVVGSNEEPFGDQIRFPGRVEQVEFHGDKVRYCIDLAGEIVWMDQNRGKDQLGLHIGDQLVLGLDPARIRILEH